MPVQRDIYCVNVCTVLYATKKTTSLINDTPTYSMHLNVLIHTPICTYISKKTGRILEKSKMSAS
jgi:hypothetical protein